MRGNKTPASQIRVQLVTAISGFHKRAYKAAFSVVVTTIGQQTDNNLALIAKAPGRQRYLS
jgi:hypothetical protein